MLQIVRLEQVEHLQRGDALPIGRKLPDVVTSVIDRYRLNPSRGVLRKVSRSEEAARGLRVSDDGFSQRSAVEGISAPFGDDPQRPRQAGIPEHGSRRGRVPVGQETGSRSGDQRQFPLGGLPVGGDNLADGKAVLGIGDRRLE